MTIPSDAVQVESYFIPAGGMRSIRAPGGGAVSYDQFDGNRGTWNLVYRARTQAGAQAFIDAYEAEPGEFVWPDPDLGGQKLVVYRERPRRIARSNIANAFDVFVQLEVVRDYLEGREFSNQSSPQAYYRSATATLADSKSVSVVCAFKTPETASPSRWIFDHNGRGLQIYHISDTVRVQVENAFGGIIGLVGSGSLSLSTWHTLLCSFDMANQQYHFYINDQSAGTLLIGLFDQEIQFSTAEMTIGVSQQENLTEGFVGSTSLLGLRTGAFLDFSKTAVRRRFCDHKGYPLLIPGDTDGSIAMGGAPEIWITDGNGVNNQGTLGAFTATGTGTVAVSSDSPSDTRLS